MSIEYANLEELCHIKTGAPMARARKIPEGGEARSVRALPPRSLQGGSIVDDELVTEEVGEINKEHFTREGDQHHMTQHISIRTTKGFLSPRLS